MWGISTILSLFNRMVKIVTICFSLLINLKKQSYFTIIHIFLLCIWIICENNEKYIKIRVGSKWNVLMIAIK